MSVHPTTAKLKTKGKLPHNIFRAYDIRGNTLTELTQEVVYDIGQAFGSSVLAQGGTVCAVGRDGRLSGPTLVASLVEGIVKTGCNVIDIGLVATPVLYYATKKLGCDSGVMLTGSHNPKDDNGLKMIIDNKPLTEQDIQHLKGRIINHDLIVGEGACQEHAILDEYLDDMINTFSPPCNLKIVIDTANGAASHIAPELFKRLGVTVIELYTTLDGNFPNHHPDPSKPKNLEDLIALVKAEKADLGFGFDGDGDRLGIVTGTGKIIWPDRQMMLFATCLLKDHPQGKVLFDVKSSKDLATVVKRAGGEPIMYKTGHSLIKAEMRRIDAVLAGEMSGHIMINDGRWFGFDDAMYNGARLLEIMQQDGRSLDEIFAEIPESESTPELSIPISEEEKFSFMQRVLAEAENFFTEELITIDGLRVEFADGWALVRASNTTPILTVRFEAETPEALKRIQARFSEFLLGLRADLELPF